MEGGNLQYFGYKDKAALELSFLLGYFLYFNVILLDLFELHRSTDCKSAPSGALTKYAKEDDDRHSLSDAALLQQIETRLKQINQKRVASVVYNVVIYYANNQPIDTEKFEIKESDLLFGTK